MWGLFGLDREGGKGKGVQSGMPNGFAGISKLQAFKGLFLFDPKT